MNKKAVSPLLPVLMLIVLLMTVPAFAVFVAVDAGAAVAGDSRPIQLDIEGDGRGVRISPTLFGAFFEDINYAADGGLYAELVQNRSFEFAEHAQFWSLVCKGKGDKGEFTTSDIDPLNANNPTYVRVKVLSTEGKGGVGISNTGFGGIPVVAGDEYHFSMYARSGDYSGSLTVSLEGGNGSVYAQGKIPAVTGSWQKSACVLRSRATDAGAKLVVVADAAGTIDMDMISLFPAKTWRNRTNGLRRDLVQLLADMKPKFLRFPGGCIVEGNRLSDAYDWKKTVGDVAERPMNINLWGIGQPYPYYQTHGLGFYEFFQLCEDIGAEPLPVVNAGMACQVRNGNYTTSNDPGIAYPLEKLAESKYVQDAIDLLEFANGPVDSKWGGLRAAMGHPEPFNLKYLAIGNENWGEEYKQRFEIFRSRILAESPYAKDIQFIVSSGTAPSGMVFADTWDWVRSSPGLVGMVDEHYYQPPEWFYRSVNRYDKYDRNGTKVFAGEYAAHEYRRKNNMMSALAEAAFMTGLVRNADVVRMASYAPLFNKAGFTQWLPDLIFFNNTSSYGTPNYYVQKMFSTNTGTHVLPSHLGRVGGQPQSAKEQAADAAEGARLEDLLYSVVSKDEKTGEIVVIVVNAADKDHRVVINVSGAGKAGSTGTAIVLTSGNLTGENSFAKPGNVVPVTRRIKTGPTFTHKFKKYSLTVLRIPTK